MGLKRSFDIRQIRPFRREGGRMPKPLPEKADEVFDLDHDLRPDEQAYVNHFIGYADVLLEAPGEQEIPQSSLLRNIIQLPKMQDPEQNAETEIEDNGKAA